MVIIGPFDIAGACDHASNSSTTLLVVVTILGQFGDRALICRQCIGVLTTGQYHASNAHIETNKGGQT